MCVCVFVFNRFKKNITNALIFHYLYAHAYVYIHTDDDLVMTCTSLSLSLTIYTVFLIKE